MKKSLIGIITIIAILLTACTKDKLRGEGPIVTEYRTLLVVGGLETVKINGSTDVHVTYGDNYELAVKGYGNLVAALSTNVRNNVLTVEFPNHYNVRNDNTEIFLTIPHLPNIDINGSSNVDASGNFPNQPNLFFHVNGSAKINAGFINVENLDVNINGSGNLNVANVMAQNAKISISGSGKVKATVNKNLKASISGSGEILYHGDASVETNISGSGKVTKF
ncbi:MAG TPA: DUF2807 domain-containing protein [Pelobium sp.]|nr:DUF2807 domain-containing protein [Pelobium sp.]